MKDVKISSGRIAPVAWPEPLQLRQPQLADAAQLLALSQQAGWNQTLADWHLLLASAGDNALSLWHDERPVASALALNYGDRFAWVCMVLVTPAWRGQGLATRLLRIMIERLSSQGLIVGLDATPAGRAVYYPLGFRDIYPIRRLIAERPLLSAAARQQRSSQSRVRSLQAAELAELAAWDAPIFGAKRYALLAALYERLPQCAFIARKAGGEISGYVLGRDGQNAIQLGPLVASNCTLASDLLLAALVALNGTGPDDVPVVIDALARQHLALLSSLGFSEQRGFSRMLLQREQPLDQPEQLFAIAGPELG